MYVILVYDVSVERVSKVCQYLRKYMNWMQNSVFEGELTKSEFREIELGLKNILNLEEDSVLIYIVRSEKALKKKTIGIKKVEPSVII